MRRQTLTSGVREQRLTLAYPVFLSNSATTCSTSACPPLVLLQPFRRRIECRGELYLCGEHSVGHFCFLVPFYLVFSLHLFSTLNVASASRRHILTHDSE
jgi:hypothetical protein